MLEKMLSGLAAWLNGTDGAEAEVARLKQGYQQLYQSYDKLNRNYRQLQRLYDELKQENQALKLAQRKPTQESADPSYEELKQEHETLKRKYESLHKGKNTLMSNYLKQKTEIKILADENESLRRVKRELLGCLAAAQTQDKQATTEGGSETKPADAPNAPAAEGQNNFLKCRIEDVMEDLRTNTYLILKRCDLNTLEDVCSKSALELLELRYFGKTALNNLNYQLGLLGLRLADEKNAKDRARVDKLLTPSRARLMRLEKLRLSPPVHNDAKAAGFNTAEEVLYLSEEQIRQRFKNENHADEFMKRLRVLGFFPGSMKKNRMAF